MSTAAERARQLIEYRPETAYAAKAVEFHGEFARAQ